jgi:hypothetical protein
VQCSARSSRTCTYRACWSWRCSSPWPRPTPRTRRRRSRRPASGAPVSGVRCIGGPGTSPGCWYLQSGPSLQSPNFAKKWQGLFVVA